MISGAARNAIVSWVSNSKGVFFNSDWSKFGVGIQIRNTERYDLMKIEPTESEAERRLRL